MKQTIPGYSFFEPFQLYVVCIQCSRKYEVQYNYIKLMESILPFSAEEPGNFHSVIINDDLEKAYREFKDAISQVK